MMMRQCLLGLFLVCFQPRSGSFISLNSRTDVVELQTAGITALIADTTSVAYLTGHFNPAQHPDFVRIDREYCSRENAFLRREAYVAFKNMVVEAKKSGIRLTILSATRNFSDQKKIWSNKWVALKQKEMKGVIRMSNIERARYILRFSSMPGTSRHHWGTDIDLNSLKNVYFLSGEGKKVYQWLQVNATKFGFCQPYTSKATGRTGYEEEKWHWSYRPLSDGFTLAAGNKLKDEMLKDFPGSEFASEIKMIKLYMLGISSDCLQLTENK